MANSLKKWLFLKAEFDVIKGEYDGNTQDKLCSDSLWLHVFEDTGMNIAEVKNAIIDSPEMAHLVKHLEIWKEKNPKAAAKYQ